MARLAARIPMVTAGDQRAIQAENAKDDEWFWGSMRDLNAASAKETRGLIAAAEAKRQRHEAAAADAGERVEAAKDRLARLKRGESVAGGLGEKLNAGTMMKTLSRPRQIRRMALYASTTEAEFKTTFNRSWPERADAGDMLMDREVRRVLRRPRGAARDGAS